MKKSLLFLAILLLAACAPATPATPAAQPVNISTLPSGARFAGKVESTPDSVAWYTLDSIPADSGVTASPRPDGGIDLKVDGVSMPVWSDNGQWVMSDNVNGSIVDFASGSLGAAGTKDGTTAYVRQVNGEWEVGIVQK